MDAPPTFSGEPPAAAAGSEAAVAHMEGSVKAEEQHPPELEAKPEVKAEGEAGGAAAAAQAPSDEQLKERLGQLLAVEDLAVTTEKMLRRKMEAEFGTDLSDRKQLLKAEIQAYLDAQPAVEEEEEEEEEGDEEDEAPRKAQRGRSRRGGKLGSKLSEPMQAFLGMESCPRTEVVKLIWAYIREHDLQVPTDRRKIRVDEKLGTIFNTKFVTMFNMNKQLSKHCFTSDGTSSEEEDEEEEEGGEQQQQQSKGKRRAAAKPAAKAAAAKPRKRSRSDAGEGGPPKLNGFTKPVRVSEQMAAWLGGRTSLSRPELTKYMWEYVKGRGLQDPENKQFVLADEPLRALTGQARFKAFSFASLIKEHILGYAD